MKKQDSLSVWFALFTLLSVIAIGAIYLSIERTQRASISGEMKDLDSQIKILNRQSLDLNTRIAKLESPSELRMRLGSLEPMANNIVLIQGYADIGKPSTADGENIVLDYNSQNLKVIR